jgi:hypothetical protein
MTHDSASAALRRRAAPLARSPTPPRHRRPPALLPHLERGQRVDAAHLRARWKPPSARPTPPAPGTGRPPMTPARRDRPVPAQIRKGAFPQSRHSGCTAFRCWRRSPASADAHPPLEEARRFQQFSTPIPLGLRAATAAAITPADRVLEPSAGTGLLAILAEIAGGSLVLNELAETRADLLSSLFPAIPVTRFDAAQIDDHLDPAAPCPPSC